MTIRTLATIVVLLIAGGANAQDTVSVTSAEVAPGFYMFQGTVGNVGMLTGDDGVFLIDDGIEPVGPALLAAIRDISDGPIEFVINTHVHGDHVGSNEAIHMAGATIVAHDNIRKRLLEVGWPTRDGLVETAPGALPQITFSDNISFYLNGHKAFVFHIENAHTDGDGAVAFPDANIVYTGDLLFNRLFPFIDLDNGGSVDGFIAGQQRILSMIDDETKIIPGHGELGDKDDLQMAVDMLVDARRRVKALVDAGKSEDQIVADNPLAMYHDVWSWRFITTERMTRTLVRDLEN
jgi:glyoxylase-like metal-dependent hydrolase (beta-lactamase superfamily II)